MNNSPILTLNQILLCDTEKNETILECISTHNHESKPGYLFKVLSSEKPLFIATAEILGTDPTIGCLYKFKGYAADSMVIGLEPVTPH